MQSIVYYWNVHKVLNKYDTQLTLSWTCGAQDNKKEHLYNYRRGCCCWIRNLLDSRHKHTHIFTCSIIITFVYCAPVALVYLQTSYSRLQNALLFYP